MKPSDKLRQNIRDIREDKKITQAGMAEKLGLSETGYAKIERGESKADINRLQKIADILEVSLADIIPFGDDSMVVFNHSNDDLNFTTSNVVQDREIKYLQEMILIKNEIIESREREIIVLQKQISTLEKLIAVLNQSK